MKETQILPKEDPVKAMAKAHWSYVKEVIKTHSDSSRNNEVERQWMEKAIKLCEFHYITAFVHGYKHGIESGKDMMTNDSPDPLSYFRGS